MGGRLASDHEVKAEEKPKKTVQKSQNSSPRSIGLPHLTFLCFLLFFLDEQFFGWFLGGGDHKGDPLLIDRRLVNTIMDSVNSEIAKVTPLCCPAPSARSADVFFFL